jgi:hypothetical protein
MKKILILNADDLGISRSRNQAILDGYNNGFLRSASLMTNGDYFDEAIDVIKNCPDLGVGIHLNIVEGKALNVNRNLTNGEGYFNNGFLGIALKSKREDFLKAVETEFRDQIESGLRFTTIDRLDSHVHVHAIPPIFRIAVKLANEYNIPFIRTQREKAYITPRLNKLITFKYPINLLKVILLNAFTKINTQNVTPPLKTNDFVIGVGYTGMMDSDAVKYGLKAIKEGVIEAIIHPDVNGGEYEIAMDKQILELATIANYSTLANVYE